MLFWATFDQNSIIVRVKILDSAVTTGAGKTGLAFNTANLLISTIASSEAVPTAYTGANIETVNTLGTYAAPTTNRCRFRELSAANHPGVYELQFADARFSIAGSRYLLLSISGAAGAAQCDGIIPLPVHDLFAASLSAQQLADIKAQVLAIFAADAQSEIGAATPPGPTAPMFDKWNWISKLTRNKKDTNGSENRLYDSTGATVQQKQSIGVAGSVVTKGPWIQGP